MGIVRKVIYAVGAVGLIVLSLALSGVTAAAINVLQFWAFPAMFGFEMLAVGAVFIFLIPPAKKHALADWAPWLRRLVSPDSKRMKSAFWRRIQQAGPFVLAFVCMMATGGFLAAVMLRFTAINERRAWGNAFFACFITTAIKFGLYMGLLDVAKTLTLVRSFF